MPQSDFEVRWNAFGRSAVDEWKCLLGAGVQAQIRNLMDASSRLLTERWDERVLLVACSEGQAGAMACFDAKVLQAAIRLVQPSLPGTLRPEELVQLARLHLLVGERGRERLLSWKGNRPLLTWVGAVMTRLALDAQSTQQFESLESESVAQVVAQLPMLETPEALLLKHSNRALLSDALREGVRRLPLSVALKN